MARKPIRTPPDASGLNRFKLIYFRRLNEVHVGTQVTLRSLAALEQASLEPTKKSAYQHFVVPAGGATKARIRRDRKQMGTLIRKLIDTDECSKALLLCIGIVEDYVHNVARMVLRAYPERLTRNQKGMPSEAVVPFDDLILKSRDDIIEERIRLRLSKVLHGKPSDYLMYLGTILEFTIDRDTVRKFCETKATRDIIIHANGRANETYIDKSDGLARVEVGERLEVGSQYFAECISVMKKLITDVNKGLMAGYGADPAIASTAGRFFQ